MNEKQIVSELEEINQELKRMVDSLGKVIEGHGAMNALLLLENRNEICDWIIPVCNKGYIAPVQINGNIRTLIEILNKELHNFENLKFVIFRRPNYQYYCVLTPLEFREAIDMLNKEYRAKMMEIPAAGIYIADYQ